MNEYQPARNVHDALRHIDNFMAAILSDVDRYVASPSDFDAVDYFRDVACAVCTRYVLEWTVARIEVFGMQLLKLPPNNIREIRQ